jgi:Leucine-rich repeat (LRR) protein
MSSVPISTSSTPSTPTTASPNYTPTATAALNGTNIYAAPTVNQSHSTPDCDAIDRPSGAFAKYFSSAPAITTSSSSSSTAIAFKNRLTSSQPASAPERPALTPFAFKQATLPSVQLIDTKSNSANAPHAIKINASPVSPVPAHLFAFLTELDLSHNMLDSCPATLLLHCPRLQRLNLSHNQFRILEHSNHLAQAKFLSLIAFDASHNPHLKQCSADFFAVFPKLQHLTLSHCAFTEFSPSLLGFNKEMKIIDLNANPMLSAQPAAFKPGSKKSSELVTDPKLKESKNGDDCVIS